MFAPKKLFEWGGIAASVILVGFGIASIVVGISGRSTVRDSLKQEQIVGSKDMTPTAIAKEVKDARAAQAAVFAKLHAAGVKIEPSPISTPSCSVADKLVNTGAEARCFAQYMRIHTFGSTSGLTYSQMGRYIAKPGTPIKFTDGVGATSNALYAKIDPKTQQTVSNGARDLWVTYTALTTALNTSYMAEQLSLFGLMVGFALLLAGIGFSILTIGGALRRAEVRAKERAPAAPKVAVRTG